MKLQKADNTTRMVQHALTLDDLQSLNKTAEFNQWCGLQVISAQSGLVEISMPWKVELGQYSGFLHAGLIATLIDTACGYAAATISGPGLLASHFSVNCLRPATGELFLARAKVVKSGKTQIFTSCDLTSVSNGITSTVATGETILLVVDSRPT